MQETLTMKRGTAWLQRFEGVVLHSDRDREMQISSSGGGGHVGPHGGYVAPPQITSSTSEHQTIFARAADSVESRFQWSDWTLPVRPGSRIAVVWGAREGYEGQYVGAANLDTRDELWRCKQWVATFGLTGGRIHGLLCFCIAFIVACVVVLAVAYVALSDRVRPEQVAHNEAAKTLREVMSQQPPYVDNHVPRMNRPQQLAYARDRLDEAGRLLEEASKVPFKARPSMSQLIDTVLADSTAVVTFLATWSVVFLVLVVYSAARVANEEKANFKFIDERLRGYLWTGILPP